MIVSLDKIEEPNEDLEDNLTQLSKSDIEGLLARMPEGYRQVFMLVGIEGFSHQEVGELLEISPETSRSQLSRARTWLKKHLVDSTFKTLANGL